MPAKYLISKSVPCNITDLRLATEEELWKEHRNQTNNFLQTWKAVRLDDDLNTISDLSLQKRSSLMDLNVELVKRMLTHCNFCRWNCQIDRSSDETVGEDRNGVREKIKNKHGTCQLESASNVSSYFHHRGEELVFRGNMGSGTIFFTSCNMRCSFCQNGDISTDKNNGIPITPSLLALMIWQLRMEGCHNTNWVGGDPTIHLHTIVQAINMLNSFKMPNTNIKKDEQEDLEYIERIKADNLLHSWKMNSQYAFYQKRFFNSPQLWNSNFFMSDETMCVLRSLMDAWLPDFKFGPGKCALDLSRTPWYWETITNNLKLIHEWGEDFVIRHLIMPNHVECCTKPVLEWIARNMPEVPINIMDQYYPDNLCDPSSSKYRERYGEIARSPTKEEIVRAYQYAKDLSLNFEALSYEKSAFGLNL
ncbi:MAG: pyruvate formate lyase activating enzyme [Nitrososphaeraceae archaeon]|nr:pyruvate formate lyase activating enzyme [Nitrososphaeraceae archaeon]